jgi:hypothetical protein
MRFHLTLLIAGALSGTGGCARASEADAVQAFYICLAAVEQRQAPAATSAGSALVRAAPNGKSCTFALRSGDPAALRAAVISAAEAPPRSFATARTRWDPGAFTHRDTYCSPPGPRQFNLLISSGAVDATRPQLAATVLETPTRDPRCDRDLGLQPALSEGVRR